MNAIDKITYNNQPMPGAAVLKKASFDLSETADTYFDMRNWGKGVVWINGHNLGRYWEKGPQQSIYVPAEWLKKGSNEIVVFELLKPAQNQLKAMRKPVLDVLQKKESLATSMK